MLTADHGVQQLVEVAARALSPGILVPSPTEVNITERSQVVRVPKPGLQQTVVVVGRPGVAVRRSGERSKSEAAGVGQEEFNPWILGAML